MLKQIENASSKWEYRGKTWHATWFDVDSLEDIPEDHKPFTQVYAIAVPEGTAEAVVVTYDDTSQNVNTVNLPGGTIELGENFEQALLRELDEEINADVLNWRPLGYQKVDSEGEQPIYQLRVLAIIKIHTPFERGHDTGGTVTGNKNIPLVGLANTIKYGATGEHLQQRALGLLPELEKSQSQS